ncbi:MAG: cytochrome b/b6 domain-containing protein, partial [Oleibacter sp.]|nr:cytochrome b/b6 domain-containing protein [Thalassolituus sp.]
MNTPLVKYNKLQIIMHWLSAGLILIMLFMGLLVLPNLPDGGFMAFAVQMHMLTGLFIFLLTLFRIVIKKKMQQPPYASTGNALLDKLGVVTHYALNIVTLLVVLAGIGFGLSAGMWDVLWGNYSAMPTEQGGSVAGFFHETHEILAFT